MTSFNDKSLHCVLHTADGVALQARRYIPEGPVRARLIVAGATAVAQGFYKHFALHAAARGFETLTLDYRGIGLSRPASLRGFRMDYLDWARQDLATAVDAMHSDTVPLVMVGHSFGGHAFGLLPNHSKVSAFYTFATGAGWHGWMPRLESLRVRLMWQLLGPLLVSWNGYLAWSRLGMGEDLPIDVFRQWRRWCRHPRYFFDDPEQAELQKAFDTVHTSMVAVNATDDLWALPASRDAFMAAYRNTNWQGITVRPADIGLRQIGHMGYFRPQSHVLWTQALDWLDQEALQRQETACLA